MGSVYPIGLGGVCLYPWGLGICGEVVIPRSRLGVVFNAGFIVWMYGAIATPFPPPLTSCITKYYYR